MAKADMDSSGLQLDKGHEAPEVYTGPLAHDGRHWESGLEPVSSAGASPLPPKPTGTTASPYYATTEKMSQYEHDAVAQQTYPYGGLNGGQYASHKDALNADGAEIPGTPDDSYGKKPERKRVFGLVRWLFITIVVAVVVIIILAAVLGGVLGSQSHHSSSGAAATSSPTATSSALPAINTITGLSIVQPSDGDTTYSYYQDPNGRIIEDSMANNVWSIQGSSVPNSAVVADGSWQNTPLAAVSYAYNGEIVRQVFFVSTQGVVATTYKSGSDGWITPYEISSEDQVAANSIAMAAIADTNKQALNGIRMYYASTAGYIQEIGTDFVDGPANLTWHTWNSFQGSDIGSGVASVLVGNTNHVYFRNSSTGNVQRWLWDYTIPGPWYTDGSGAQNIVEGSDLAVSADQSDTDILYFEGAGNQLVEMAVISGSWQSTQNVAQIEGGSKFTATYYNTTGSPTTGTLLMYQLPGTPPLVHYELRSYYPSKVIWDGNL